MPSGVMLSQLARHLVSEGHEVTVYTTFPSLPGGTVFPGYPRGLWKSTNQDGVRLTRCFSFVYGPRRKPLWRVLSHLSFTITSAARLLLDRKPNIIVIETLPIITAPWLVALSKILGVPVVNYIKDLYPESGGRCRHDQSRSPNCKNRQMDRSPDLPMGRRESCFVRFIQAIFDAFARNP